LYIIPTTEQKEKSDLNLAVAGTKKAINMVEAGANELSEEEMLGAIMFGHEAIKKLCAFQEQIIAEIGKPKRVVELYTIPQELIATMLIAFLVPATAKFKSDFSFCSVVGFITY